MTLEEPDAWNIGLSWQPWSGLKLRGSWLRGDTLGLTFSSQVGTKSIPPRREAKRTVPQNVNAETGLPDGYDPGSWYDRMLFTTEQSGLYFQEGRLHVNERKASMVIENCEYNLTADVVHRGVVERASDAVRGEERGHTSKTRLSGPTVNYTLQRLVDVPGSQYGSSASDALKILAPRDLPRPTNTTDYGYPSLAFGVDLAASGPVDGPR